MSGIDFITSSKIILIIARNSWYFHYQPKTTYLYYKKRLLSIMSVRDVQLCFYEGTLLTDYQRNILSIALKKKAILVERRTEKHIQPIKAFIDICTYPKNELIKINLFKGPDVSAYPLVRAVLLQSNDGKENSKEYVSCLLTTTELNYNITDC